MNTRAVLFDLGSTLWDDYPAELHQWGFLSGLLSARGIEVSLEEIIERARVAIASYSPSLTRAILWHFVGGDRPLYDELAARLSRESIERFSDPAEFRRLNPLFPGIHELLEKLARRCPLAVVSQNFGEARHWMTFHNLAGYFRQISLSHAEGLYKPDPRLFLVPLQELGVAPGEAAMVGDRLDNDIWPANRLHMRSVRVLADPYRIQVPRYHCDVPDYTLGETRELLEQVPL